MVRRPDWADRSKRPATSASFAADCPKVDPVPPADLPTSRLFRGIGQAFLNTTLDNADDDVQVVFKSSPMGTRSHGNAANNSFVLWAYGQRLLTRTGHYYMYGGPHHRDWVWSTRSLNNITVNGQGQVKRSAAGQGQHHRRSRRRRRSTWWSARRPRPTASDVCRSISAIAGSVYTGHSVREAGVGHRVRSARSHTALDFRVLAARDQRVSDRRPASSENRSRRRGV